jgi:GAF domain-containing protein
VSQTISLVTKGEVAENFEYSLTDTLCADINDEPTCVYPEIFCSFYPNDKLLTDMKIEGYLGSPLFDSNGNIMGFVVALYENTIQNSEFVVALFELFAGRISAEIERSEFETKLVELNLNLEKKVKLKTTELTESIQRLRFTQD